MGARIGGTLSLGGARMHNPGGYALRLDRVSVDLDLFFQDEFTAHGEVKLSGAHVRGLVALTGARFANPGGRALDAYLLSVDQDLDGEDGFAVEGEFRLARAQVGGSVNLRGARLANPSRPDAEWTPALDLEGADVRELVLRPREPIVGGVDLTNAHAGRYADDPAMIPPGRLGLRGFTYDTLDDDVDVRTRLRWLTFHPDGYNRQIYSQLAAAYRRTGHEEAARRVALTGQWRRRRTLGPLGRVWNWLLCLTVGYGYRPWLAAVWLAALLALGTGVFSTADLTPATPHGPAFTAVGYTLDVLLPIVDLGQQRAWQAQGAALYWTWAFMAAGWVLTTAVAAGLTGLLRRGE